MNKFIDNILNKAQNKVKGNESVLLARPRSRFEQDAGTGEFEPEEQTQIHLYQHSTKPVGKQDIKDTHIPDSPKPRMDMGNNHATEEKSSFKHKIPGPSKDVKSERTKQIFLTEPDLKTTHEEQQRPNPDSQTPVQKDGEQTPKPEVKSIYSAEPSSPHEKQVVRIKKTKEILNTTQHTREIFTVSEDPKAVAPEPMNMMTKKDASIKPNEPPSSIRKIAVHRPIETLSQTKRKVLDPEKTQDKPAQHKKQATILRPKTEPPSFDIPEKPDQTSKELFGNSVSINIGTVEISAVQGQKSKKSKPAVNRQPALSLEEYLKKKTGGTI